MRFGFLLLVAIGMLTLPATVQADPDCAGPDRWPANMAFVRLKNAGVLTNDQVDFPHVRSRLIASQKIALDRYRQVFDVTFPLKGRKTVEAIVVNDASSDECSIDLIAVYRVTALTQ